MREYIFLSGGDEFVEHVDFQNESFSFEKRFLDHHFRDVNVGF